MQYQFQWDPSKARSNLDKHKTNFRTAEQVFEDPVALTLFDEAHSSSEDRWITLGVTLDGQYLLIVHTVEESGNVIDIRIISARRATKQEIRRYQEEQS